MTETKSTDSPNQVEQWWLSDGKKPQGPYSKAYVQLSLERGLIHGNMLACPVGGDRWKRLCDWTDFSGSIREPESASMPDPPSLKESPVSDAHRKKTIFTHPSAPRMAKIICVYYLLIVPGIFILTLFIDGDTVVPNPDSPWWLLDSMSEYSFLSIGFMIIGIFILLFVGGWMLWKCYALARPWLITILYVQFACMFFTLGVSMCLGVGYAIIEEAIARLSAEETAQVLAMFGDSSTTNSTMGTLDWLLQVAGLITLIFGVVALVWLHRHGKEIPARTTTTS